MPGPSTLDTESKNPSRVAPKVAPLVREIRIETYREDVKI